MKSKWIIDQKTCTSRLENAGKGLNGSRWDYLRKQVDSSGNIAGELLGKWFKFRSIKAPERSESLSQEAHALLKAAFCMLQIGCVVFNREGRIAVFLRPDQEAPTGVKKITNQFSILRSWSPTSTAQSAITCNFVERTRLALEDRLQFEDFGLGYNELTEQEPEKKAGAGYFFIIKKARWNGENHFTDGEQGGGDTKSGERLLRFFDPEVLINGAFYNDEPIELKGRMDRLILESIVTGSSLVRFGNLAAFSNAGRVMGGDVIFSDDANPLYTAAMGTVPAYLLKKIYEKSEGAIWDAFMSLIFPK